ncbi:hypothetical protein ACJDT4_13385 [Clostridium neuense]|uniref:Uncharacterized protein n=1 Tax=Clostridium neuense TaxID=1728934 RepID=A0ABW8TG22_9CLOT
MRNLNLEDTFTITKMLKKMNIRKEIKECIKDAKKTPGENNAESLGIDIALLVVENISSAEKEIYTLFSSLTEKKVEEVKKMGITEVVDTVKELFTNEDMKKVFSTALSLKK